jgi:Fe-S cluster assembly ATP-binding protein
MNGKIVKSGGKELISKIDAEGYDWIKTELGIEDEEIVNKKAHAVLGSCAFKTSKE